MNISLIQKYGKKFESEESSRMPIPEAYALYREIGKAKPSDLEGLKVIARRMIRAVLILNREKAPSDS
jgi:hypothetical protein